MKRDKDKETDESGAAEAHTLAPMVQRGDIASGIQAFRRGEMVIYTVRGDPETVRELMSELERQGVGPVVALVSHPAEGGKGGRLALNPGEPDDSAE
jgi:hypothetical protein